MKTNISDEYKNHISTLLNEYIMTENWHDAKLLLKSELQKNPDDHFLLTQFGEVLYEMQEYEKAIEFTEKAYKLAPNCPLTLNNHAVVLYINEKNNEAIQIWKNLLEKNINEIAESECGDGLKYAKSLINDIRFRIGDAYLANNEREEALNYYKLHLTNRKRGLFSNFTKNEVEKEIKELEKQMD